MAKPIVFWFEKLIITWDIYPGIKVNWKKVCLILFLMVMQNFLYRLKYWILNTQLWIHIEYSAFTWKRQMDFWGKIVKIVKIVYEVLEKGN